MTTLNALWDGNPAPFSLKYTLVVLNGRLQFSVEFPHEVLGHPQALEGAFTPELWKWDVAEYFIYAPSSGKYVEVNLAPSGAYWVEGFKQVRVADEEFSYEVLDPVSSPKALELSLLALESYLGSHQEWCLNVTAILGTPSQAFLSETRLPGAEADFHQPEAFPPYPQFLACV